MRYFLFAASLALVASAETITFDEIPFGSDANSQYSARGIIFNMSHGVAYTGNPSNWSDSPALHLITDPGERYSFLTVRFQWEGSFLPVEATTISLDLLVDGLTILQSYPHGKEPPEEFILTESQTIHLSKGRPAFLVVINAMGDSAIDNLRFEESTGPQVITTVPEPGTLILSLSIVGVFIGMIHRRKRKI